MGKHNIEKKSIGFSILRVVIGFWHNIIFYRKIVIINRQNIPKEGNIIFTPNHQNALMDALALISSIKRQLVFVARADIFAKKSIAAILYYIKILPIYRIRDGFNSLKKNEETFAKVVDVLKAGNGLVILPEGNHGGRRKLRPLKKGFARIALQAEEANDFGLDLKIVPVGIDYDNYESIRSTLTLNFGEPISVSDYYKIYKENAPVALTKIKENLAKSISKVMIDIRSNTYYELYDNLRNLYSDRYCQNLGFPNGAQPHKFEADKLLIEKLEKFEEEKPKEIKALQGLVSKYQKGLKNANISPSCFEKEPKSIITILLKSVVLFLLLPLYLYGLILNILPYQISLASTKIFKDRQFFSSAKMAISLFMFPIFYTLEIVIFSIFVDQYHWFYLFMSMCVGGIISWALHNCILNNLMDWRLFLLKNRNAKVYKLLRLMLDNIFSTTDKIVSGY